MNKKILFLTLFILIILLCNNSYAFEITDFNATYLNDTSNYDINDFITYFNDYFSYRLHQYKYFIMIKGNGVNYVFTSATPFGVNYTTRYNLLTYFDTTSLFNLNSSYSYFDKFTFTTSQSFTNSTTTSGVAFQNLNNLDILYSNYDIINIDDHTVYFTKNFDLQSSSEESEPIDMTEIIAPLEHIKALLFYICLYLLCKTIYGVIWWIYKKSIL